ncbi:hypothetical protein [Haloferula sp. A504]|uniref:hypothetical protein n=1 Tax=Haloferula sp. A504 TaxID=3373601 RepID=UPI0031C6D19C|nr:hypothetical protein [Verrucomicrobiaceae bacterium E54]
MSKKEKTIGVRVDPDLQAVIAKLAEDEERPLAAMVRILATEALKRRKLWPPKK